jgi:hypothetical protein
MSRRGRGEVGEFVATAGMLAGLEYLGEDGWMCMDLRYGEVFIEMTLSQVWKPVRRDNL